MLPETSPKSMNLHLTFSLQQPGEKERSLCNAGRCSVGVTHSIGYNDANHKRETRPSQWPKPRDWEKLYRFNLVLPYLIYVKASCWLGIWKCVHLQIVLALIICRLKSAVTYIFQGGICSQQRFAQCYIATARIRLSHRTDFQESQRKPRCKRIPDEAKRAKTPFLIQSPASLCLCAFSS